MTEYKISIIIPTFNIEKDIERAIDSLINQTIGFENLEVIIVDDCSTDNTKEIILSYEKEYENIKPIFLENNSGSAGKPRNIGIQYATSKYIMFLDNDDEYVNDACKILYDTIKENNANIVICSKTNNIYKSQQKQKINNTKISSEIITQKINVLKNPEILYYPYTQYGGAMWCKIFKKKFILKNNIKCLEKLPEDLYFMHQCYYLNPEIIFITNRKLYNHYFYRVNGETITTTSSPKFIHNLFIMFNKLETLSQNYENTDKFFNKYVDLFFNELILKIIISNASKKEKISLIKEYSKNVNAFNPKMDNVLYNIWYWIMKHEKFRLCFQYTQLIKFMINVKSKL